MNRVRPRIYDRNQLNNDVKLGGIAIAGIVAGAAALAAAAAYGYKLYTGVSNLQYFLAERNVQTYDKSLYGKYRNYIANKGIDIDDVELYKSIKNPEGSY
jgi:hypothetical protein